MWPIRGVSPGIVVSKKLFLREASMAELSSKLRFLLNAFSREFFVMFASFPILGF